MLVSLVGQDLTLTLGRTIGADLSDVQTLPAGGGTYTLPQATESDLGGVEGASQAQAQSTTGDTILGWTNTRIRQLIAVALPTVTNAQAIAATGTTRLIWTVSRVRELITAALPTASLVQAESNTGSSSSDLDGLTHS